MLLRQRTIVDEITDIGDNVPRPSSTAPCPASDPLRTTLALCDIKRVLANSYDCASSPFTLEFIRCDRLAIATCRDDWARVTVKDVAHLEQRMQLTPGYASSTSINHAIGAVIESPLCVECLPLNKETQVERELRFHNHLQSRMGADASAGLGQFLVCIVAASIWHICNVSPLVSVTSEAAIVTAGALMESLWSFTDTFLGSGIAFTARLTLEARREPARRDLTGIAAYWSLRNCDATNMLQTLRVLGANLRIEVSRVMARSSSWGTARHEQRVSALTALLESANMINELSSPTFLDSGQRERHICRILELLSIDASASTDPFFFALYCQGAHSARVDPRLDTLHGYSPNNTSTGRCRHVVHHFAALAARIAFAALQWAACEYLSIGAVESLQATVASKGALHRIDTSHEHTVVELDVVRHQSTPSGSSTEAEVSRCEGGCCGCDLVKATATVVPQNEYIARAWSYLPAGTEAASSQACVAGNDLLRCEHGRRRVPSFSRHEHRTRVLLMTTNQAKRCSAPLSHDKMDGRSAAAIMRFSNVLSSHRRDAFRRLFTVDFFVRHFWVVTGLTQRLQPRVWGLTVAAGPLAKLDLLSAGRRRADSVSLVRRVVVPSARHVKTIASVAGIAVVTMPLGEDYVHSVDSGRVSPLVICTESERAAVIKIIELDTWKALSSALDKAKHALVGPLVSAFLESKVSLRLTRARRLASLSLAATEIQRYLRCIQALRWCGTRPSRSLAVDLPFFGVTCNQHVSQSNKKAYMASPLFLDDERSTTTARVTGPATVSLRVFHNIDAQDAVDKHTETQSSARTALCCSESNVRSKPSSREQPARKAGNSPISEQPRFFGIDDEAMAAMVLSEEATRARLVQCLWVQFDLLWSTVHIGLLLGEPLEIVLYDDQQLAMPQSLRTRATLHAQPQLDPRLKEALFRDLAPLLGIFASVLSEERQQRELLWLECQRDRLYAERVSSASALLKRSYMARRDMLENLQLQRIRSQEFAHRVVIYYFALMVMADLRERCSIGEEEVSSWRVICYEENEGRDRLKNIVEARERFIDGSYFSPTRLMVALLEEQRLVRSLLRVAATSTALGRPVDVVQVSVSRGDYGSGGAFVDRTCPGAYEDMASSHRTEFVGSRDARGRRRL